MKNFWASLIVLALASKVFTDEPVLGALDKALERIGNLPIQERKVIISWVYKEVYPETPFFIGKEWGGGMGMGGLVPIQKPTLAKLLAKHKDILAPLLKEDLRSGKKDSVWRALDVIAWAKLTDFFEDVAVIFQKNKAFADDAAHTLTYLGGPRVIRLLIEKDPKDPLHYEDHLRSLSKSRPADPLLVKLLRSKDAATRAKVCQILMESRDDALVPEVIRLVKDDDPKVRLFASLMGFNLSKESLARVRPALITLLADKNVDVRLSVTNSFVWNGDKVCARTLLDLLHDKSIRQGVAAEYWDERWLWDAVWRLSGIDSPYLKGADAEQAAIRKFAEWVKKNAPAK
jgi:HEAT repeat protein